MQRTPAPSPTVGSESDIEALFERVRHADDHDARNRLVEHYLFVADRCARRYRQRGEPLDDLLQVARMGLVRAVERFDPGREVKFETFAVPTVLGELRHHFRDNCWAVTVPRRAKELRTSVQRATETLAQQLGRQPDPSEVAELLEIDVDRVLETQDSNQCFRTDSWDPADDDVVPGGTWSSAPVDDTSGSAVDRVDTSDRLSVLDGRLQRVVFWRFYEQCTQREIGERLGVGQVQVSRLLAKAVAQLRAAAGLDDPHDTPAAA